MLEELKKLLSDISSRTGITGAVDSALSDTLSQLESLDSALTKIGRASGMTEQQLEEMGNAAFEAASEYGRAAEAYLSGIQRMYDAGFSNAKDMADAMEAAAETAAECGIKINELSALIAAATAETAKSGAEVGAALDSIFTKLQDTSSGPVCSALKNAGVSMTEFANGSRQLKTPVVLLGELSHAFQSFDSSPSIQADILGDIGGDSADILLALLNNWGSYGQMLELYSDSMGDAFTNAAAAADILGQTAGSLSRALGQFTETWTETSKSISDSALMADDTGPLESLLSVINDIGGSIASVESIWGVLSAGSQNIGKCV